MTDRMRPATSDLRRWPSDPALLVDTTRCPACFAPLLRSQCDECGLRLDLPGATELLAAGARVRDAEAERQQLITGLRARQAAAADPWGAAAIPQAGLLASSAVADDLEPPPLPAPGAGAASAPVPPPSPPDLPPSPADHGGPLSPGGAVEPSPHAPRRSGVQIFLLALGVVLLSVAAIVFLLVAYLIATLEVRSLIIGGASAAVLALAWLLRVRGLSGTAEGVAAVGVVLIVLDVWIVRANGLFGTDRLDEAGYWGGALALVALLMAGARAVSGVRVPGFAAALAAPIAAFLLAFSVAPAAEPATGIWLGGLAASLVGTAAAFVPLRDERLVTLATGFAGTTAATFAAAWSLPGLPWSATWAFLAVAVAWAASSVSLRSSGSPSDGPGAVVSAVGAGATASIAPALGSFAELDWADAVLIAPSCAAAVVVVLAVASRYGRRFARDARAAFIAAAVVAGVALLPAIGVAVRAAVDLSGSGWPTWSMDAGETRGVVASDLRRAVILALLVAAAASAAAAALFGRLRRAGAVPIALLAATAIAAAAVAPTSLVSVIVLLGVAGSALGLATVLSLHRVPGTIAVLASAGMPSAASAWWVAHSSTSLWPWVVAAVIALAIAGRVLARAVWGVAGGRWVGTLHVAAVAVLLVAAAAALPSWADATGPGLAAPWSAPAFTVAVTAVAALAVLRLLGGWPDADRSAAGVPLLAAATIATSALAAALGAAVFSGVPGPAVDATPAGWAPALALAVVGVAWVRAALPALPVAFAAVTPLAAAFAGAGVAAEARDATTVAVGSAVGVLAAAVIGLLAVASRPMLRVAWTTSAGVLVLVVAAIGLVPPASPDATWLVLLLAAPVPLLLAAQYGDPLAGSDPTRHLAWGTPALAVGSVWSWFGAGEVTDVEAYTLPLAIVLATVGILLLWRRPAAATIESGRTLVFATALAVAVLPSVAMAGGSELRTLVLVAAGSVAVLASAFLPDHVRGLPLRLLVLLTGWTAATLAAVVRAGAVALGESSELIVEFWPVLALLVGVVSAFTVLLRHTGLTWLPETLLAASVGTAAVPTVLAIANDEQATARAAAVMLVLGALHVASVAVASRPVNGAALGVTSLTLMVVTAGLALPLGVVDSIGVIDPVDLFTGVIGSVLIAAGAIRLRRSREAGSWPTLGPGLAVLLLPALLADWADPEVWRLVTLGVVSAVAVVVGVVLRLQAPFAVGGGVLLVHAIAQLWPWVSRLYEAEWWWLWLGIAGAALIAVAATYERQLRLARSALQTFAALR
ncbi:MULTISPECIES: SCO7613 C-terminal domain-containing membrane protein [unclassified Agromyces]|uniref:SCO7613 C-terminal domain-containing membrane protein n=1 Tax=unclassified Agromyces TaxID=2639701 RepID=UPI0030143D47